MDIKKFKSSQITLNEEEVREAIKMWVLKKIPGEAQKRIKIMRVNITESNNDHDDLAFSTYGAIVTLEE